jgi:nucleoside-diphosphate-sugar epimerase
MRVCVVGATGVLGRQLVPLLAEQGHSVRALARRPREAAPAAITGVAEYVECDLLSAESASRLPYWLEGGDAVVHIATAIPRDFNAPGAWEANSRLRREGTERLLVSSIAAGVKRYVQQSVALAYAPGKEEWLDESAPLDRSPERAETCAPVIDMEEMVRGARGLEWVILRAGIFVGPGTFQESLAADLRNGRAVVPGDGSSWISPIHVADMAAAVSAALRKAPPGSTFNAVDEPVRHGDYMDRLARIVGAPPPPREPSMPPLPSIRCTNRAAREVLGWAPLHGIWPVLRAA